MFRISTLACSAALIASTALSQTPVVVADMPVTHSLVSMVAGDLAAPEILLDAGADPHDFQLRPSQARALSQAGLVVWMGAGMTPWMADAISTSSGTVLDLSAVEGLFVQGFQASALLGEDTGHENHDHGDHGHDDHGHDDHGHDEHAHDGIDPHLWLDPANARAMLGAIGQRLGALDPSNAAIYDANARAAQQALDALDGELAALLAPARDTGLVVFHDAYGYFAGHYGLRLLGSIAEGDAAAPGAQRLATIRQNLSSAGAECLFPEVNQADRLLALVAEGTDLRLGAPLDPEGRGLEPGAGLYPALMRALAQAIADCAAS